MVPWCVGFFQNIPLQGIFQTHSTMMAIHKLGEILMVIHKTQKLMPTVQDIGIDHMGFVRNHQGLIPTTSTTPTTTSQIGCTTGAQRGQQTSSGAAVTLTPSCDHGKVNSTAQKNIIHQVTTMLAVTCRYESQESVF